MSEVTSSPPPATLTSEQLDGILRELLQAVAQLPEGPRGRQADDGVEAQLDPEFEPYGTGVYFEFRDRRNGKIYTADNFELARGRLCLHERLTKDSRGLGSSANVVPMGGVGIGALLQVLALGGLLPGGPLIAGALSGAGIPQVPQMDRRSAALALLQSVLQGRK